MISRTKKRQFGQPKSPTQTQTATPVKEQPKLSTAMPMPTPSQPVGQNMTQTRMAGRSTPPRIQSAPASPFNAPMPALLPSRASQSPADEVQFVLEMPQAKSVAVAGTFNGWDPAKTPMKRGADAVWRARLSLPVGRHEYRFVVDGQWISDPKAREHVSNPYGGTNSVIVARRGA